MRPTTTSVTFVEIGLLQDFTTNSMPTTSSHMEESAVESLKKTRETLHEDYNNPPSLVCLARLARIVAQAGSAFCGAS